VDFATRESGGKMMHERMSLCAIRRIMNVFVPQLLRSCSKLYLSVFAHFGCKGLSYSLAQSLTALIGSMGYVIYGYNPSLMPSTLV
jgi:hypothetical protein